MTLGDRYSYLKAYSMSELSNLDDRCTLEKKGSMHCLYHGCCMLTNQIAQLEVGNFHKHLPRGGYFLPVGLFKLQG